MSRWQGVMYNQLSDYNVMLHNISLPQLTIEVILVWRKQRYYALEIRCKLMVILNSASEFLPQSWQLPYTSIAL